MVLYKNYMTDCFYIPSAMVLFSSFEKKDMITFVLGTSEFTLGDMRTVRVRNHAASHKVDGSR